jgi:serine/threonine protein kinase
MNICINPNCRNPQNRETLLFCQSCGSELLLDGRYRVTKQMGCGGFGKTYEVLDCTPNNFIDAQNRFKVLKVLIHNHPKYVELFQREAQVLAQLNHSGIPHVDPDDYFTYQPENSQEILHCLVMEKIEGLNLEEYTRRRGRVIKQKRAIQWLIELISILREVHDKNFFHRDIKPSNIMLRANGQLVLIDFGTARQISETLVSKQAEMKVTGVISAGYTPLEQIHGQAVPQSDFFALGRTFVYLLTGKEPNDFYDSVTDKLCWREATCDVSPLFADFLERLMARLPQDRPQTAVGILQELREIYQILYPTSRTFSSQSSTHSPLTSALAAEPTEYITSELSSYNPTVKTSKSLETTQAESGKITGGASRPLSSVSSSGDSKMPLHADFISRCQQELAELIGPMASIICKRALQQNSQISRREFVEKLAEKIPDQQQALEFQKRLLI